MSPRPDQPLVSIVVPVLDEEGCVAELSRQVREVLQGAELRFELLFVDDGSRDGTPEKIAALRRADPAVKCIRFTRRFGHQAALTAGLRHARGDAVVTMDGDLQHPPAVLPTLVEAWRGGADVVQTLRRLPSGERPGWKESLGRVFYRLMSRFSRVPLAAASADFRLLDRRVVDAFNRLDEHFVFTRGLIPWLGFPETRVEYEVGDRFAGQSKYDLWRMWRLGLDGLLSFSVVPLRVITALGLLTTLFGLGFGVFTLFAYFTGHVDGSGWTTLVVLILVFGGVQLLSVGLLAEYVGRTYEEVKGRPRYVIESTSGVDPT